MQGEPAQTAEAFIWPSIGGASPAAASTGRPDASGHRDVAGHADQESPTDAWRAEVEAVRQSLATAVEHASQQGRAEGQREGDLRGREQAAAQVEPVMARLLRTIEDLSATRDAFRREAEEDIVRLALGIARRVVHREVTIDGTVLLGVIRAALDKIGARELHRILVSPADQAAIAAGVESLRLNRRIEVVADANLERGAVLFETVKGSLDASLETQLDEIERGLIDALDRRPA